MPLDSVKVQSIARTQGEKKLKGEKEQNKIANLQGKRQTFPRRSPSANGHEETHKSLQLFNLKQQGTFPQSSDLAREQGLAILSVTESGRFPILLGAV